MNNKPMMPPKGSPMAAQAMDLSKMLSVKILTGDDPDKFAKDFQNLVRQGWSDKSVTQNITWSEQQQKYVFGFCAFFIKQGV